MSTCNKARKESSAQNKKNVWSVATLKILVAKLIEAI